MLPVKCQALTKTGKPCNRDAVGDSKYCWQHQNEVEERQEEEIKLTEKQKVFCDEYIISLNATDAARKAGYSKKTARQIGQENLSKPYIQKYIQRRLAEKESERIATQNEVLEYLTAVMRGEIQEEAIVVENIGNYQSRAKKILKQVDPKDRNKAAELLGKRYGLFRENVDLDITSVQIIDDIE